MKQQSFFKQLKLNTPKAHGGDLQRGKRKTARPFHRKLPLHVVFRSSKAKGEFSFLTRKNEALIERLLNRYAKLYRIKVYRFQNIGNHLHLLIQTQATRQEIARRDLSSFLRRFAGEVTMQITQARKGAPVSRFWDQLVYSRIVTWGREFEAIKAYFIKNLFEAAGYWDRKKNPDWKLVTVMGDSS